MYGISWIQSGILPLTLVVAPLIAWLALLAVVVYMAKVGSASELDKLARVVRAFWWHR